MGKFQTQHGLNFYLDDDFYIEMIQMPNMLFKFGRYVEASELFPIFTLLIAFVYCTIIDLSIWLIIAICSVVMILSFVLSSIATLFKIPLVVPILSVFQIITKFFLDVVFVVLYSIFIVKQWYLLFIYFGIRIIIGTVMTLCFGYARKERFNNKIAEYLLKKKENKTNLINK